MLQQLDDKTKRILELADFIDGLEDDQFDMRSWGKPWSRSHCICGWLLTQDGFWATDDWREAADRLGLDEEVASKLFSQDNRWTQHEAAKVLRHLAVTGELLPSHAFCGLEIGPGTEDRAMMAFG